MNIRVIHEIRVIKKELKMRKWIIWVIGFILLSSNAMAYNVLPDSVGNTINLRINNISTVFTVPQVRITKQSLPGWVTNLSPNEINLGTMSTNRSATATFTFNVASTATIGARGDIRFQVNAGSGDSWNKDVSLTVINPYGAISGNVDVEGLPTPSGATLTVTGPVTRSIVLGIMGWYTMPDLPAGTYTVTVAKQGYVPVPANRVERVNYGETTRDVDFTLIRPYGAISGTIDVNGNLELNDGAIVWALQNNIDKGSITTGWTGNYTIRELLPGTYTVKASKAGYTCVPASRTEPVTVGQTTSGINFALVTPPGTPSLNSPANGANINNTLKPRLDWDDARGAGTIKYRIQVAKNTSFSPTELDIPNLSNSEYTPGADLSNNSTYYWRVYASNEAGTSSWSEHRSFNTRVLPAKPTLISPSDQNTIDTLKPSFDWNDAAYVASYRIQVDDNNDFTSTVIDQSGLTGSAHNPTSDLAVNTTYYWRVQSANAVGTSSWSDRWWFKTPSPPSAPGLSSPANGSTINNTNKVTLSWGAVTNATSYQVQVSKNSNCSSPIIDAPESSTSYTTSQLDNNTYYWQVKAKNAIGWSGWSSIWKFTVALPTKGDFWFVGDLPTGNNLGVSVELWKGSTRLTSGQTDKWGDFDKAVNYVYEPGTDYKVRGWKDGYKVKKIILNDGEQVINVDDEIGEYYIAIQAGKTTKVEFEFKKKVSANIILSSPSAIRNAETYSSFISAMRAMVVHEEGSLTTSTALPVTTSVTPILSSGKVKVLVTTSNPLLEAPALNYTVSASNPEKVILSGSGANFVGQVYIESTTSEGTATFNFYGIDELGSPTTHIEYGQEFVIDTTIYPEEGGEVSNRDGSAAKLLPKALSMPVNITITATQSAGNINLPPEINNTNYVPLLDSSRQFRAKVKENEVVNEVKGLIITLPYQDQDQDGIVDNTGVVEDSLKILQLQGDGSWEVIEGSQINKETNLVRMQVNAFTTYMLVGASVITTVDKIISYPNPWYPEKVSSCRITFIPLDSQPRAYIYNIAGELVRTLEGQDIISTGQGYMEAVWDGKNDSGTTVAYGVYIYVVECNKGTKKGKIGIIR